MTAEADNYIIEMKTGNEYVSGKIDIACFINGKEISAGDFSFSHWEDSEQIGTAISISKYSLDIDSPPNGEIYIVNNEQLYLNLSAYGENGAEIEQTDYPDRYKIVNKVYVY
jgi:hypothetical protein